MKKFTLLALIALAFIVVACASPTPEPTKPPAPTAVPAQPTKAAVEPTKAPVATAVPAATKAPEPTKAPEAKPLKIGLLTDQSGALAIYGPLLENGFALGLEYATEGKNNVAGRPIQIITKDTASKTDVGTQVARDLIEKEGVDVLVGVPSSGVALAVAELAKQNKKIYIAQPAASPDLTGKNFNPYVFRTSRTSVQDALASGAALKKLGKTYVQIAPDYAFGYGSAGGFYDVVKANGGTFAINDSKDKAGAIYIPQDAKDFTPYLQKVLDTKAEVLIVTWAGAGFVPLFTQMQQLGVFKTMQVYTGMGDNQTLKAGYANATGASGLIVYHYTMPKNPINDWLVQKHKEKFKSAPDLFTEGGFTAAQMLVAGLKATNGDATADKLIPVLEKLSFDGPKGKYTVRDYDHVMLQNMYVAKLTNVTDADFKFFELLSDLKPEETAPTCTLEGEYASRCPKK
ncbi:MAG: ABC transporter substrate-binding protein [Chloroflexi bacterium]|nr:ABC transporter substrate-binding protein [Chloroflexota bacterium]